MWRFSASLVVLFGFYDQLMALDLCKILDHAAKAYGEREEIRLFRKNNRYLPRADKAGYMHVDGQDVLMLLERMNLSFDETANQFLLVNTVAYPHGTAAPNQWYESHPEIVDMLRSAGNRSVFKLSPVYLNDTADGTGQFEFIRYSRGEFVPETMEFQMETVPYIEVRNRTYRDVRKISYVLPGATQELSDAVRMIKERYTEYYAPGVGKIRRERLRESIDVTPAGDRIRPFEETTTLDYEPIAPGSLNSGLMAEHLATLAVQRTPDDFQKSLRLRPEFSRLTPEQAQGVKLIAEIFRSQDATVRAAVILSPELFGDLLTKGLSEIQIFKIYEHAQAFFDPK